MNFIYSSNIFDQSKVNMISVCHSVGDAFLSIEL